MSLEQAATIHFTQKRYNIEAPVGKFPVIEVTPLQSKTDIPVVMAPGWSEPPESYINSQSVLASKGRRSLVFDHPRWGGRVEPNPDYLSAELRKAVALLSVIEHSGSNKVDVIAHSEGGVYAVIAAMLQPEKLRNLVLVGPAGVIGHDTFPGLLGRFTKKVLRNLAQGISDKSTTETVIKTHIGSAAYIAKNPIRALSEAVAVSKSDTTIMLEQLHAKGIGIVLIHHAGDEAIPMHRIQQVVKAGMLDGVLSVTGLHDDLYVYPHKYTAAAEEMLSALEKKQAKKELVQTNSD